MLKLTCSMKMIQQAEFHFLRHPSSANGTPRSVAALSDSTESEHLPTTIAASATTTAGCFRRRFSI